MHPLPEWPRTSFEECLGFRREAEVGVVIMGLRPGDFQRDLRATVLARAPAAGVLVFTVSAYALVARIIPC